MRKKITLAAAGFAVAASFLPVSPANAVCIAAWQAVTGQCSPCTTAGPAVRFVREQTGIDPHIHCVA